MSSARILLLVVAIVAGGLAAFLATRGGTPEPQTVTVTEVQQEIRSQILVASQPIGVGERLSSKVLEWQDWPKGAVRPEYVTFEAEPEAETKLTGAVARFEIFVGEPIREAKLVRSDQGYLSAVIQPGMRGVSVSVTATSGAGGFIVPNDRVDVILTQDTSAGETSETILFNVKVLAIGQRLGELGQTGGTEEGDADPKSQNFIKETIATLEMAPNQAEAIVNASEVGNLALILRSVADFAEEIDATAGSDSSIQMIRFGQPSSVTTGASSLQRAADPNAAQQMPITVQPLDGQSSSSGGSSPTSTSGPVAAAATSDRPVPQ